MYNYTNHVIFLRPGVGIEIDYLGNENFITISGKFNDIQFKDTELKADKAGKYIVNIDELVDASYYSFVDRPANIEIPAELIDERNRLKRLNIFAKEPIGSDWSIKPEIYFYLDNYKLQAVQGEKVVYADEIVLIHGRKAINIEAFGLKTKFLELPKDVCQIFEKVLSDKEMESLCLIPVGESLLDGNVWYRLSLDIPPEKFNYVKDLFEFYMGDEPWQGQLTKNPAKVSQILGIPIKGE